MMEVILREDVKSLGKAGELVRVKPGYARNFLLPQGPGLRGHRGQQEADRGGDPGPGTRGSRPRGARPRRSPPASAAVTVTLTGKAGEEGKLFGSITAQDIADGLASQGHPGGQAADRAGAPDQDAGRTIPSTVRLHPEVHAEVRVTVVAE